MSLNSGVAVIGVGFSEASRKTARSLAAFAVDAISDALNMTGLKKDDIDGYMGAPEASSVSAEHMDGVDEISCRLMQSTLGLPNLKLCIDAGGVIQGGVPIAIAAVASGMCKTALVVRAMHFGAGQRYSESGRNQIGGPEQFSMIYGKGRAGVRFAQWLTRYFHETGANRDVLYKIVRAFRDNALLNPHAVWREHSITEEEYMASRYICEPLCLYDCDMPVNTAGALIITSAERALDLVDHPAFVSGWSTEDRFGESLAEQGLTLSDFGVAELYDGYSCFILSSLEKLGYCGKGEAADFVRAHDFHVRGDFPVNTFGGNLGEGRLHGLGHVREGALQVMNLAGDRQIPDLERCLIQVGSPGQSWVLQLSRTPS